MTRKRKKEVGGVSDEATNTHFAQKYPNSVARAQVSLLDPKDELNDCSNFLIELFAGEKLLIADTPAGAGAASLAFLSTIAELRKAKVLPATPLEVDVVMGDISPLALKYAEYLIQAIAPSLAEQSVFVQHCTHSWDALDVTSTVALIKTIVQLEKAGANQMTVVANFEGFLVRENNFEKAAPQIEELLKYTCGPSSLGMWIEPQTDQAIGEAGLFRSLLNPIIDRIQKLFRIGRRAAEQPPYASSSYHFYEPTNKGRRVPSRVAVLQFDMRPTA